MRNPGNAQIQEQDAPDTADLADAISRASITRRRLSMLFFMSVCPPHSEQGPHSGRGISPHFVHLLVGLRSGEQSVVTGMCCSKTL
jgi:hypothetical protein